MQICIVLPSGTLAHSTIHYTGNTAILLALRSNAANLLVRRCTRVCMTWLVMSLECAVYAVITLFWGFQVVHHGCNGKLRGLPDRTHVCGVHLHTSPMWIRVRTHVHASRCMHMRVYSFTVSDSFLSGACQSIVHVNQRYNKYFSREEYSSVSILYTRHAVCQSCKSTRRCTVLSSGCAVGCKLMTVLV